MTPFQLGFCPNPRGTLRSDGAAFGLGDHLPDADPEDPDRVSLRGRLLRDQGRAEARGGGVRDRPGRAGGSRPRPLAPPAPSSAVAPPPPARPPPSPPPP